MGVPPLADYLRAGMRVGLGTDSPAATDSTDLFIEMRTGMLLQRAVTRNMFLDSATMLEMATMGGARALRMEDKIGSLEVGKLATSWRWTFRARTRRPRPTPSRRW